MDIFDLFLEQYRFNRDRTLAFVAEIAEQPDSQALLGWRPGPGRAHVAWQLMHIGVTEEIFATERLAAERERPHEDLWPRFRGQSTPDDEIPSVATIRQVLDSTRGELVTTLAALSEDDLDWIPPALAERGWSLRVVLGVLCWHESHHQGQAHLTRNLFRAAHPLE